ncbi:MAG: efflux RND transporter periplasmic adaptor subunit [Chloroflexota bacterium]
MKHKRPPIPVLVIVVLAVIVGGYFLVKELVSTTDGSLAASGTIEAVTVSIAPEIGGRVAEVFVAEGQAVRAGEPLFRLDDAVLQAQRQLALANLDLASAAAATSDAALETAGANYDLALAAARAESAATRTADWRFTSPGGYDLPGWYFAAQEQIAFAAAEADASLLLRDEADAALDSLLAGPANASFLAAENRLAAARAAFVTAQDAQLRVTLAGGNSDLRDAAQAVYDDAQAELDAAQAAFDELADSETGQAVREARAGLAVAEERYQSAQDRLLALQTGVHSPRVTAAEAVLNQARAAAGQARLAVGQAEASLALVELQISKLTVLAPSDGVILARLIEPGEVVAPGGMALTLARLENLTITVYIPQDRYGELSPGQAASVTVDSFPGVTFNASIVHIADQAEFTPRNVQTAEGRASTVYAIRLQVADPDGRLKPGMPADVTFSR